ncbi:acid protease [Colletotrichum zoysiae]|uniref:Acid protease n=1 Tax=Colletotrichum zoysiae TaxID=1216348 RepID=A0AAD9LZH7_9PEZI|nr:acid protease [Colletotrichum zoysiae]
MRASSLFAGAACAAAASAQVRLPFARREITAAAAEESGVEPRSSGDRRSTPKLDVLSDDWSYLVDVSVGTPPQQMSLRLSVQSGTSWVLDAKHCKNSSHWDVDVYRDAYAGCRYGALNASKSSTFLKPGIDALNGYIFNDYISGRWVSDVLDFAGIRVPKFVMGFVDTVDTQVGVLGLGFNETYSPNILTGTGDAVGDYLTLPERLVKDGNITSPAYSLWHKSTKSGNVLLGAVDRSKFEGPLTRIRAYRSSVRLSSWSPRGFDAIIHSARGKRQAGYDLEPLGTDRFSYLATGYQYETKYTNVRLAPDYPISNLPSALAEDIWRLAGASSRTGDRAIIPCAAAETSTGHIEIQLYGADGPILNVSIADLVLPKEMWSIPSRWARDSESATEYCLFAIQTDSSSEGYAPKSHAFGGAMLRHAYMVFDPVNAEMAFAQAKLDSTATEDIVPFASYGARIPGSTRAKQAPSYCSDPSYNGDSSECTEASGSDGYGSGGLPPSISRAIGVGVGVGFGLFGLAILFLCLWAIRRGRRIREAEKKESLGKQADVEQEADTQVGAGVGDNVAQDGSPPQKPPSAVAREPPTANEVGGRHDEDEITPVPRSGVRLTMRLSEQRTQSSHETTLRFFKAGGYDNVASKGWLDLPLQD